MERSTVYLIKNRTGLTLKWRDQAWDQYTKLILIDRKAVKKINQLIKSIQRDGHRRGLGKPEPLRYLIWPQGTEMWSRRINKRDRLVYIISTNIKDSDFMVLSCRYHYHK